MYHSHLCEIGGRKAVPGWQVHISSQEVSKSFLQVSVDPEIQCSPTLRKCFSENIPDSSQRIWTSETALGMKIMPLFQLPPSHPLSSACPSRPTSCETSLDALVTRHSNGFVQKMGYVALKSCSNIPYYFHGRIKLGAKIPQLGHTHISGSKASHLRPQLKIRGGANKTTAWTKCPANCW